MDEPETIRCDRCKADVRPDEKLRCRICPRCRTVLAHRPGQMRLDIVIPREEPN